MDKGNKKKKKGKIVDIIIFSVLFCVFVYSGIQLMNILRGYWAAEQEYEQLQEYVTVSEEIMEPVQEEEEEIHDIIDLKVNFNGLKAINADVVGWIYIPVLGISYPVTQGDDNDYYLKHTYSDEENSSGSIFLDCDSNAKMRDRNTFIYGHNMKNGSMFGSLKKFRKEEGLCASDPYIYYYTADHHYKYQIFAYYITKTGSKTYFNFYTDEQYDDYMTYISGRNEYAEGLEVDLSAREPIITLSTCSGAHTRYRLIVHAVLIDHVEV